MNEDRADRVCVVGLLLRLVLLRSCLTRASALAIVEGGSMEDDIEVILFDGLPGASTEEAKAKCLEGE